MVSIRSAAAIRSASDDAFGSERFVHVDRYVFNS